MNNIINPYCPCVTMYTDGSAKSSIQGAGWATFLECNGFQTVISGSCPGATNNRMELLAVLMGLRHLNTSCNVTIFSDSALVVNTLNKYLKKWKKNNFKTSTGKKAANLDIILAIDQEIQRHASITTFWVHSHTNKKGINYIGNDIADYYAQLACVNGVQYMQ